jgi:hypothetical protein
MSKLRELVDNIRKGKANSIKGLFFSELASKTSDKLSEVKKEVAKGMFTPKKKKSG